MKRKTFLSLCFLVALMGSCDKKSLTPEPPKEEILPVIKKLRAIIVNEGIFGRGTASLTTLSHKGDVTNYFTDGLEYFGDVAQSIEKIGNRYYVPFNNNKSVQILSSDFKKLESIKFDVDVVPMYTLHLGGDSIAVTDQRNDGKLMIVGIGPENKSSFGLRRYVDMGVRTFQLNRVNNKLFIGGDAIHVFDMNNITNEGKRKILDKGGKSFASCDFSKVIVDYKNNIWVLGENAAYCIDSQTEKVINEVDLSKLSINNRVSCIDISPDKKRIYFNVSRKVYTIDVDNPQSPSADSPIINYTSDNNARTVYSMSVSMENTVFFNEARYGSVSKGVIYEYNPENGELIQSFKCGQFPHYIYFVNSNI